jgi:superfamily II RNA helicase
MISSLSDANLILQLNMSKEKSFVIIFIMTATLADEKKLVQIVVLKSLSTQMFHVLLRKLDDLLDRCIFHMSIS